MLNRKLKSEFIKVASLENQMKAEITKMKQLLAEAELEELKEKKGLSRTFKKASRAGKGNNFGSSLVANSVIDAGTSFGLFGAFLELCDSFSPDVADALETASEFDVLEVISEVQDPKKQQGNYQKRLENALEKDMKKQAKDKKVALGEKNTLEGTKSRLDMMNDRFADVKNARQSGVQYVELNETGLDIPKRPGYYRRMNKAPKMALAA